MTDTASLRAAFDHERMVYEEMVADEEGGWCPGENVDLDDQVENVLALALLLIDADYGRNDDAE